MYINTEQEMQIKSEIWHELNKDYLEEKAEKDKEMADMIAKGKVPKKRRPRAPKTPAASAAEAASDVLQKRVEKSAKINYTALRLQGLFNSDIEGAVPIKDEEEGNEEDEDAVEKAPPKTTAPLPVYDEKKSKTGKKNPSMKTMRILTLLKSLGILKMKMKMKMTHFIDIIPFWCCIVQYFAYSS